MIAVDVWIDFVIGYCGLGMVMALIALCYNIKHESRIKNKVYASSGHTLATSRSN